MLYLVNPSLQKIGFFLFRGPFFLPVVPNQASSDLLILGLFGLRLS